MNRVPGGKNSVRDNLGGKTAGGAEPPSEIANARQLARDNVVLAVETMLSVMQAPGRGGMVQLMAAQAVLKLAAEAVATGDAPEVEGADLTPADVELMRRFLAERSAAAKP